MSWYEDLFNALSDSGNAESSALDTNYGQSYDPSEFTGTSQQDVPQEQESPLAQVAQALEQSPGAPVANPNPDYDVYDNQGAPKAAGNIITDIMKGMGLGKDLSNPKTLEAWTKLLMGGGSLLSTLNRKGTAQNSMTPTQLAATLPGQDKVAFTPTQAAWSNKYFQAGQTPWEQRARLSAANMGSPIVAGRGYAEGGDVEGALSQVQSVTPFTGFVQGPGGGQDDLIDARLAAGEYVFDADVVSALGDGDNARGAEILDQFRQNLREHKRSATADSIPPMAEDPGKYLPQGALSQMGAA